MSKRYKKLSELPMFQRPRFGLSRINTDILMISFVASALATLNNAVTHKIKLEESILAFLAVFALSAGLLFVFSIILRTRIWSIRLLQKASLDTPDSRLTRVRLILTQWTNNEQHTNKASTEPWWNYRTLPRRTEKSREHTLFRTCAWRIQETDRCLRSRTD